MLHKIGTTPHPPSSSCTHHRLNPPRHKTTAQVSNQPTRQNLPSKAMTPVTHTKRTITSGACPKHMPKKIGQDKTCLHSINREWKLDGLQQSSVRCRSMGCTHTLPKTEIMPLFINGLLKIEMSLFLARKLPDYFLTSP